MPTRISAEILNTSFIGAYQVDSPPEFRCPHCGIRVSSPSLCSACRTAYFLCVECGGVRPHREAYNSPDGMICHSCYNGENDEDSDEDDDEAEGISYIHNYSYKPEPLFAPKFDPTWLFFGVELETDNYPSRESLSQAANHLHKISQDENRFYLKADGSLHRGVEVVTHPATLEYHRDSFPWADIMEAVRDNKGASENYSTCGLHVHFNATYFDKKVGCDAWYHKVHKLMVLFKIHERALHLLSRREEGRHKYSEELPPNFSYKEKLDNIKRYKYDDRNKVINITPAKTVELRFFKGTLEPATLLASIELTDFLVRFAKKETWRKVTKTTWAELTAQMGKKSYLHLPQYLKERGV